MNILWTAFQIWWTFHCFCLLTNNVDPTSWGSVDSAIFILVICACVTDIVFNLRILCQNLLSHLPVLCYTHTVTCYNTLRGNERVRTHCQHCYILGCPFFPHRSFHSICELALTFNEIQWDSRRTPMSTSTLNTNRLTYFSFFACVTKNINKSPDIFFYNPRLILDSIYFGDYCFRTGVGRLLPVFVNAVLLEHNHTHSFMYYLWLLSRQWQSWAIATEMVWSSKPKPFTIWPFTAKGCHLCFRKWMELGGPRCLAQRLHAIHWFTQTGATWSIKVTHGLLRACISMSAPGRIILAGAQELALILPNRLSPRIQLQLELERNQQRSGSACNWVYLYHGILITMFDRKHSSLFFYLCLS